VTWDPKSKKRFNPSDLEPPVRTRKSLEQERRELVVLAMKHPNMSRTAKAAIAQAVRDIEARLAELDK
jgi:hypothetical protein